VHDEASDKLDDTVVPVMVEKEEDGMKKGGHGSVVVVVLVVVDARADPCLLLSVSPHYSHQLQRHPLPCPPPTHFPNCSKEGGGTIIVATLTPVSTLQGISTHQW